MKAIGKKEKSKQKKQDSKAAKTAKGSSAPGIVAQVSNQPPERKVDVRGAGTMKKK